MTAENFSWDARYNGRQVYSDKGFHAPTSGQLRVAAYRLDEITSGEDRGRCLDIVLHFPSSERLLVAIGLPVVERNGAFAKLVWPAMFAPLGTETVQAISSDLLRMLNTSAWKRGEIRALMPPREVFGADYPQLISGRCCPGLDDYWNLNQHLKRYQFAVSRATSGRVLDVAIGAGYGSCMVLGPNPGITRYVGADLDPVAIGLARRFNSDPRFATHQGDFAAIDETFDWIISLETIEHVADPDAFVDGLMTKLAPGGRMVISLPSERWDGSHLNPDHWTNWNLQRVKALVEPRFASVELHYYERPTFNESPFDITTIRPYRGEFDVSSYAGTIAVLGEPRRQRDPQPRLVVRRRYARGDVLQATPVVRALRQRYPHHRLAFWTDINEVFADNPHVDLLISGRSAFKPTASDIFIDLDQAYERVPKKHILEAYAETAGVALANPSLELYLAPLDFREVGARIGDLIRDPNIEYVLALHMGTTPDRTWPQHYWVELVPRLLAKPGVGLLVVGAGNDFQPAPQPRVVNLVNRLDFRATAAALALADVVVGPDSAMLHVAGAVGTSAVGLYGMADPDKRIPIGAQQIGLQSSVDCAGCLHDLPAPNTDPRCKFGKAFCYEAITTDQVYEAIMRLLADRLPQSWRMRGRLALMNPTKPVRSPDAT